jgi:hypothetical protein
MTQIQQQQNPQLIKNTTSSTTMRQITTTEITMTQMITRTNTARCYMWHVRDTHPSGSSKPCVWSNRNGFRAAKMFFDTHHCTWRPRGSRPEVVQYFTHLQPDTTQWTDLYGRTPLHLHKEFCCVEHSLRWGSLWKWDGQIAQKASSVGLARTVIWWGWFEPVYGARGGAITRVM